MRLILTACGMGLSLASSVPVFAQRQVGRFETGNDLLRECEDTSPFVQGACVGYIIGVSDLASAALQKEGLAPCLPKSSDRRQLRDVVTKALKDEPSSRAQDASALTLAALLKAFPC